MNEKMITKAEEIVLRAQQIATLLQLSRFIRVANHGGHPETGMQAALQLPIGDKPTIFISTRLLEPILQAQFKSIYKEIQECGIDPDTLLAGEEEQFQRLYNQQP